MRKSLILALTALGGSAASYAAGVTKIGPDLATTDPATWRWHVSSILADQALPPKPVESASVAFQQGYQRYSPLGVPERKRP